MKNFKKLLAVMSSAAIAASVLTAIPAAAEESTPTKFDVTKAMGLGWNLGNSLDAIGGETAWGNPKTTKELIDKVHDLGFNTVRVPISWGKHMDGNYTIDSAWLDRVQEVVDYAYDDGMYVIINIHHDNDIQSGSNNFFYPNEKYRDNSTKFVTSVWRQVSEKFKDYDEHLVFETLNEPRLIGDTNEWWFTASAPQAKVKESIGVINDLNQAAVDTIRASGGENATRLIMCPGYDASLDGAATPFYKLPNDKADMVALSVHAYSPYNFAMNENGTAEYTDSIRNELMSIMKTVKTQLVDKGNAVVIGEFGATNKKNSAERAKWATDFTNACAEMGVSCCLWDNNAYFTATDKKFNEKFGLINRKTLEVDDQVYLDALVKAQKSGYTHTFDNGTITKAATITSEGTKTHTCVICGKTTTSTIPKLKDISKATATLAKTSVTYTGSVQKPAVTVKLSGKTLSQYSDYIISYSNNIKIGTATVTIKGRGEYSGEIKKTFKITGISIAKAEVSNLKANKYYTGKAITQTPVVKVGTKTLKAGTDYTVTFKNNKAIGKATITIKGKGKYTGTITKTFKIIPKKTTLKTATSPKAGQLKVTYTKQSNITGYQITYAKNSAFTKSKASKSSAKLTKTISGLKKGTYYVKVRTYKTVKGVKYYSGYSTVKKVKVK